MKVLKSLPFALVTIGCLVFGGMKVIGAEQMLQNMSTLHYPEWFTRLLGLGEVLFGIAIWFPRFKKESILILFGIFSGAIGSHLGHGDPFNSVAPAFVFLVLTTVLYLVDKFETRLD